MRFARALLASFGAGTCLVLAGTLAMATLSTVVAFSGLPGVNPGADGTPPAILAAVAPSAGAADVVPVPVALVMPGVSSRTTGTPAQGASAPGVETAGAQAAAPTATSRTPQAGPSATTPTPAKSVASDAGTGSVPPAEVPAGARAPGALAGGTAPAGGPVRDAGTAVGGIVTGVGGGLADTVRPASPPAATILGETTKVAGETVEAATDVVAAVVEGLNRGG